MSITINGTTTHVDHSIDDLSTIPFSTTPTGSPPAVCASPLFRFSVESLGIHLVGAAETPKPIAEAPQGPMAAAETPKAKKVIAKPKAPPKPQTAEWRIKYLAATIGSQKLMFPAYPMSKNALSWKFAELANTLS